MRAATAALIALLGVFGALTPAISSAEPAGILPDGSGLDQYVESLPGAGGNTANPGHGDTANPAGGNSDKGNALSPGAAKALEERGSVGIAVASFTEATAPSTKASNRGANSCKGCRGKGSNGSSANGVSNSGDGQSPLVATLSASYGGSSESGMGMLLPLILLVSLIAAVAIGVGRFNGRGGIHPR